MMYKNFQKLRNSLNDSDKNSKNEFFTGLVTWIKIM